MPYTKGNGFKINTNFPVVKIYGLRMCEKMPQGFLFVLLKVSNKANGHIPMCMGIKHVYLRGLARMDTSEELGVLKPPGKPASPYYLELPGNEE